MDTDYPKLSNAQYKTDKKTGEVTVVVADGKTLNIPLAEYDGFKTPSLKPNVEDSIIPLDITDDIESLHIPELHAMDFITRQVVDYIKSLGIPVHTREELIQYLKDHGYENIQQAFEEQREMQDIRERAIKNGQIKLKADGSFDYALAPNGKKSNLNERQWLQVRTKPFINWFGDWMNDPANASKVVDENGEPLVVYHGGSNTRVFDTSGTRRGGAGIKKGIKGTYFTTSKKNAEFYEEIYTFKTSEEWIAYADQTREEGMSEEEIKALDEEYEQRRPATRAFFLNVKTPIETIYLGNRKDGYTKKSNTPLNYDGEHIIIEDEKYEEYVATNPNQIKSATDNLGTFSTENDDIQMAIGKIFGVDKNYLNAEYISQIPEIQYVVKSKKYNKAGTDVVTLKSEGHQNIYLIDHSNDEEFEIHKKEDRHGVGIRNVYESNNLTVNDIEEIIRNISPSYNYSEEGVRHALQVIGLAKEHLLGVDIASELQRIIDSNVEIYGKDRRKWPTGGYGQGRYNNNVRQGSNRIKGGLGQEKLPITDDSGSGLTKSSSQQWNEDFLKALQLYATSHAEIYGFIDPETLDMYLDDATINPEHPIHEYTHLWDRALYGMDPDHKILRVEEMVSVQNRI